MATTPSDLFARHHRDVYRFLVRMSGRRDVADDLLQEVFLRVVRALANGGPIGHERGWIFSVARSVLVDFHRRAAREVNVADRAAEVAVQSTPDLAHDLARSLAQLPHSDREVFLLKEVAGLSYEEIAGVCECTVESVRSRLYRTRSALRVMLSL